MGLLKSVIPLRDSAWCTVVESSLLCDMGVSICVGVFLVNVICLDCFSEISLFPLGSLFHDGQDLFAKKNFVKDVAFTCYNMMYVKYSLIMESKCGRG